MNLLYVKIYVYMSQFSNTYVIYNKGIILLSSFRITGDLVQSMICNMHVVFNL